MGVTPVMHDVVTTAANAAGADVAGAECLPWRRMQAEKIAARSPALGKNSARSHAAPAAPPASADGRDGCLGSV